MNTQKAVLLINKGVSVFEHVNFKCTQIKNAGADKSGKAMFDVT